MRLPLGVLCAAVFASAGINAQRQTDRRIHSFTIDVQRTSDGVALSCVYGCSWTKLTFSSANHKPTHVNENGMTDGKNAADELLIRFVPEDKSFSLNCQRGCAWDVLKWGDPPAGHEVRVNEFGMTEKRSSRFPLFASNRRPTPNSATPDDSLR
jgi:hypothetical protein